MAKFCKYCGTPLAEGQVCTCPQAQADAAGAQPQFTQPQFTQPPQFTQQSQYTQPPQQQYTQQQYTQQPQAPRGPSPVGSAFHNLVPYLKAYFRSPMEATRSAIAQKDLFLPIILLAIQMIVVGLTVFSALSKFVKMVMPSGSYYLEISVSAPFITSLLVGIITAALAMIVYILLMFAVAKIMGSACSFQDVLIASGANSLFVTAAFVLTFVAFFLSMKLGFILLLVTLVVWMGMSVPTVQALVPNSDTGKFWICYVVGALLSLMITLFILDRSGWMAVKGIKITEGTGRDKETYTLGDQMESSRMDIDSFSELFGMAVEDAF